jgi:hypothetical protein
MLLSHTTVIAVDIFITWARGGQHVIRIYVFSFPHKKFSPSDFNKPALKGFGFTTTYA